MSDGHSFLTVITNGQNAANKVQIINRSDKKARVIFSTVSERKKINTSEEIQLAPKECLVMIWE
jgi:hypothetical protein